MRIIMLMGIVCLCGTTSLQGQSPVRSGMGYTAQLSPTQTVYQHLQQRPDLARTFLQVFQQMDQVEQQLSQMGKSVQLRALQEQRIFLIRRVASFDPALHQNLDYKAFVGEEFLRHFPAPEGNFRR